MATSGLLIFRYNLRLHDNEALAALLSRADHVDCLFVFEPEWDISPAPPYRRDYSRALGAHRARFQLQSLENLKQQLQAYGQDLNFTCGEFANAVGAWLQRRHYDCVAVTAHPGVYERAQIQTLQANHPDIAWFIAEDYCVFDASQVPLTEADWPLSFSQFRKQVETRLDSVRQVEATLEHWQEGSPAEGAEYFAGMQKRWGQWQLPQPEMATVIFAGGAAAAQAHVTEYLAANGSVRHYKQTRNGLDGWGFSAKLSPWLAQGCLSGRALVRAIREHEAAYGSNESTYWLQFEILWREYFQWLAYRYGAQLFQRSGIRGKAPLQTFYSSAYRAWRSGTTQHPLINACMRQLNHTGWLSNRSRQIVASYLVHDLGVDWRYGAAWFEQQLIDYDCAANWGNWQYLGGVGTDPRGHRRFDPDKQQQQFDPDGCFTRRWNAVPPTVPPVPAGS